MKYGSTYTLNGREYRLLYTADAYFDINEAMGEDFMDKLVSAGRESYETALGCFIILQREGELARRYMGYDAEHIVTEGELRRTILPGDIIGIKNAVLEAIYSGLKIERAKEDGPIDAGLAEYEKKTQSAKSPLRVRNFFRSARGAGYHGATLYTRG